MAPKSEITVLLRRVSGGDENAPRELLPLVYEELRKLAQSYMRNERPDHTLQATALVHEAYLRLVDWENVSLQDKAHFCALASQVMRRILVDHARQKRAQKRDFGAKLELDEALNSSSSSCELDLIDLDDALKKLATFDGIQAKIVELRFFGGLTIEETAQATKISPATVKREWTVAKTWLYKRLKTDRNRDAA